jgi:hypothetical protein
VQSFAHIGMRAKVHASARYRAIDAAPGTDMPTPNA